MPDAPTRDATTCSFRLPDMDCPSCVTHVEQALDDGVGVADVTVNLVEQTVAVSGVTLDEADLADRVNRRTVPPVVSVEGPGPYLPRHSFRREIAC